jgi:hypothetical protein
MFPFRYSSIFRSRWMALFWAAGIVWMAIDVAGPPAPADNQTSDSPNVDSAELKQAQKLMDDLNAR